MAQSKKRRLLSESADLDAEYLEQQRLSEKYGRNRAGRRRVAAEMRRWRAARARQKARKAAGGAHRADGESGPSEAV